ncbi:MULTISPECIES: PDZ domain-containing protein [unclassified Microbacterium]|uniref:YlbL family protein n=1 Tax=unclassified Microbacterium TaxID=2609290 RepID=UPI000EA9D128|nr:MULTISPECIES: PDZ domain-containing protein [unclassified Microbacterium]MBT2485359.1 PDZ domain-containing protein [Microbacterium sp. ISL-108]RKN68166.1 PDZ domain-containing protein [Microbacterium sp. CGR2]
MDRTRSGKPGLGVWALIVALVALVVLTFLPTPYVIQRPGPVYDTLGTATGKDGEEVPLISVEGTRTYETAGALDLTTVQVVGNRERTPSWLELALAWTDSSRAVVPLDSVFPEGVTTEQRDERNAMLMVDSQHEATAAALNELGYDTGAEVVVVEAVEGTPSDGLLEADDVITAIDGTTVTSATQLREAIQDAERDPVALTVLRDGEEQTVEVAPEKHTEDGVTTWLIGITLRTDYDFEVDVTIQLDNVGGPSAGMMFALGIVDTLTEGELNGGENIAGTGTIDAAGTVGPIGGIRQKLYGARDADAEYFLAPAANCDEVVGHVPDGLQVIRTATLEESLDALEVIADGGDVEALPACEVPSS